MKDERELEPGDDSSAVDPDGPVALAASSAPLALVPDRKLVRVYKYGLLPPTAQADRVREQMRLAHVYRNVLVEIERGRRAAVRSAYATLGDGASIQTAADEAEELLAAALRDLKAARSKARTRAAGTEVLRQAVTAARTVKIAAMARLREHRRSLREDPVVMAEISRIEALSAGLVRGARALSGLYWGTYLLVEAAHDAMRKRPLYDGAVPNDPHFERWRGDGRIGVQLQGGLTVAEMASGQDSRLRLLPRSDRPDETRREGKIARARRGLALRVGSDGRAPIFAEWSLILHRPLPQGATIKWAIVHLRRHGPREEWSVDLTLELAERAAPLDPAGGSMVAVDVGWRRLLAETDVGWRKLPLIEGDDAGPELRVGSWLGDDGQRGEIRVPARLLRALEKPSELRSLRDEKLDVVKAEMGRALADLGAGLPDWLREATRTLAAWRSAARLAVVARRWRQARFPGDAAAYDLLQAWAKKDHHLWAWESGTARSSLRWRREVYRIAASQMAKRYAIVVLEDLDLRVFARRKPVEDAAGEAQQPRTQRQRVAASSLVQALREAFHAAGGDVLLVPAADTTRVCGTCGSVEVFDAAREVWHACGACGTAWDQDQNACVNMLRAARERLKGRAGSASTRGEGKSKGVAGLKLGRGARLAARKEA